MGENIKSLNSGVLVCGASQFKANIPSIQGVTLSPATNNPVNFVFETTKDGAASFEAAMLNASVPNYVEEYTKDGVLMHRIFAAIPLVEGFFAEAEMFFDAPVNIYCYQPGMLPNSWMVEVLRAGTRGSNVYFVNSVGIEESGIIINAPEGSNIFFMKDVVLKSSAVYAGESSTIVINGAATMEDGSIVMQAYDPENPEDCNTTLILASQTDVTNIAQDSIAGDIMNLYYSGEWNATTRAWFSDSIFNLNGVPLDPIPNE